MFRHKPGDSARSRRRTIPTRTNGPSSSVSSWCSLIRLPCLLWPTLAPKDPREQKLIIQIDDTWLTPPYPAFTPGYPLGSDNLGRDLFSWLLWSVRPTMILVMIVALLRLALGLFIGDGAGWSDRWAGRPVRRADLRRALGAIA